MTIRFECPDCAQLLEVDDDAAGMRVRCGSAFLKPACKLASRTFLISIM